jgi:signal transduction histidine kinase
MVVAAYSVGAWSEGLRRLVGLFVVLAPLLGLVAEGGEPADLVSVTVLYGGAWSVGRIVAGHRQQAEYLSDQAEALQRAEPERRAAAAAEERARIARELHDIVSHSISVIAVQTQAVRRRLGPEQERERDDLRAVETTARQAMVEMRRLFGVLRSNGEDPPLAPQPGLDQLQRLVDRSRTAGLEVELRETGERMHLPPGVDLAAYRIIQESLTNVLKHSAAAAVRVTVAYDDHAIDLRVEDTGAGGQPSGAGQGLIGMRERVSLYGGSFAAGPREGGGFAVRATLPLHEREQP